MSTMTFQADEKKTRFDLYYARDIAGALNDVQTAAERVQLDAHAVELVLEFLARRFKLEIKED